jgi:hypothetical protein
VCVCGIVPLIPCARSRLNKLRGNRARILHTHTFILRPPIAAVFIVANTRTIVRDSLESFLLELLQLARVQTTGIAHCSFIGSSVQSLSCAPTGKSPLTPTLFGFA